VVQSVSLFKFIAGFAKNNWSGFYPPSQNAHVQIRLLVNELALLMLFHQNEELALIIQNQDNQTLRLNYAKTSAYLS